MNIGVLEIELLLKDAHSLKDKRSVLRKLKDKLRNNFNVSVAEAGEEDKWQRSVLAVVAASNDKKHLSGYLDSIVNFIESTNRLSITGYTTEIL